VADLKTSVVEATKKAFASDPKSAEKLNPDRGHPGPSGQLLMAAALLKAWNAPAVVSEVKIRVEGEAASAEGTNTRISGLSLSDGNLTWSQLDDALPFPIDLKDPLIALATNSSD